MAELFQKSYNFVKTSIEKTGNLGAFKHLERTVYWIEVLEPNCDEFMKIAAIAHDIKRVMKRLELKEKYITDKNFMNEEFLRNHQERGGEIMYEFLLEQNAPKSIAEKVKHLISRHEWGGDDDQNLLKDADSISFFECNAQRFVEVIIQDVGKEAVQEKFRWMFERITSPKALEIAKPLFEKYSALLVEN